MSTVSPPPTWTYALRLTRTPKASRIARMTVRAILTTHDLPDLLHPAELLTSELVTNTYLHTQGPATLRLTAPAHGGVRVGVWDTHPHIPEPFAHPFTHKTPLPPPHAEQGRGLHLVQEYADAWGGWSLGHTPHIPTTGKLLWFELKPH